MRLRSRDLSNMHADDRHMVCAASMLSRAPRAWRVWSCLPPPKHCWHSAKLLCSVQAWCCWWRTPDRPAWLQDPEHLGKGPTPVSRLLERYFTADSSAQARAAVQRTLRANRRLSHISTHETEPLDGELQPAVWQLHQPRTCVCARVSPGTRDCQPVDPD